MCKIPSTRGRRLLGVNLNGKTEYDAPEYQSNVPLAEEMSSLAGKSGTMACLCNYSCIF